MNEIIEALRSSIASRNWYGSLFIALAVPDICGYLEFPKKGFGARYKGWFDKYMLPRYRGNIGHKTETVTILSARDCYALRCALFHQGMDDITTQPVQEVLKGFHFTEPPRSGRYHLQKFGNVLQLQIDIFCLDVIDGVRAWCEDIEGNQDVVQRAGKLLKVYPRR